MSGWHKSCQAGSHTGASPAYIRLRRQSQARHVASIPADGTRLIGEVHLAFTLPRRSLHLVCLISAVPVSTSLPGGCRTTNPLLRRPPAGSRKEHTKVKLQRKSGLRALTVGAVAITGALVLTACGSDNNSTSTSSTPSGQPQLAAAAPTRCGIACEKGRSAGLRLHRPAERDRVLGQELPAGLLREPGQLQGVVGSGEGIDRLQPGHGRLRRLRLPAEAGGGRRVQEGLRRRPGHQHPDGRRPDRRRLQPARREQPGPGRAHPREDLQLQDHQLERPGDQGAQPGRHAARHQDPDVPPPDDSGTTDNLTKYLKVAAAGRLAVRAAQGVGRQGRPGRARSSGVSPHWSSRPRAPSATSSCPTRPPATSRTVKIDTGAAQPVEATTANASAAIAAAKVVGTGDDLALDLSAPTPPRRTTPTRSSW